MTVFFTSDLHLGHAKVAEIRGFESTDAHDAAIAEMWRTLVRPGDQVWILGDVTANGSARVLEPAMRLLWDLPGEPHLIAGNHDAVHPMHRDAYKHHGRYWAFASIQSAARRRIEGREVVLSHFPYERDRGEARHMQWRLRDEGRALLHGHTHGDERVTRSEVWPVDGGPRLRVELHVGLDAWGLQLVPLETVAALLADAYA